MAALTNDIAGAKERMAPEILERETVYQGYIRVQRLKVRLPDGAETWREVARHGDSVAVLPFDATRRCALTVRLFRLPAFDLTGETYLEEACAGMIDEADADESAAARREAFEELGVRLGELEPVGRCWSSPGVSAERISLFLSSYTEQDRVGPGGGLESEHEAITVVEAPLARLVAEVEAGRIVDLKLLALVQALRLRRPALFAPASARDEAAP
jgi:nudix-type nucleoside diphosphatase (YffH/AdpP family)